MTETATDLLLSKDASPKIVLQSAGAIILIHTEMETALLVILDHFLDLPRSVLGPLFVALTNRARVDIIKRLSTAGNHKPDEMEAVEFAVRCFDICAENRNIVAHSTYTGRVNGRFKFFKIPTTPGAPAWHWALTEAEIVDVALTANHVNEYITELWGFLNGTKGKRRRKTLPERPPQPRKLSLFRLPEDQQGG